MPIFRSFLILLLVLFSFICLAQEIKYEVESQAIATSNGVVPFWMRSNQHGSIPSEGISGSFLGRAHKDYDTTQGDSWYGKKKLVDWGAGFEGRANLGERSDLLLIEGYGKVRLAMFEFKAGRTKDVMGLNGDTTLSSGNFAVSGNALGIPKVEISIPEYWTIPGLDGLISIKGNVMHGWLGRIKLPEYLQGVNTRYPIYNNFPKTYFHQKSFYGRLGKTNWKLNLYGGFNHNVFWGNERNVLGPNFELNQLQTYLYVLTGQPYSNTGVPSSKIGNHLGTIDLGLEYNFIDYKIQVSRQNFYDVGALSRLANIRDGLNSISVVNKRKKQSLFHWNTILLELLYTKHQAGEFGSKLTKSGDENYYNNYVYTTGWSYKNLGLGTPFIGTRKYINTDLATKPSNYFINNRVIAFHLGSVGTMANWVYTMKATYSLNYGTFGTSPEGHSLGELKPYEPKYGLFGRVNQFSAYFEANKILDNGLNVGGAIAVDKGDLLYNSVGGLLKVSKTF